METIKNVAQLFVGANIAKTATANLVIDQVTDIADGEVCVVDPRTNTQVTSAGYPAGFPACGFKLIQRSGARLIHSDIIKPGSIKTMTITLPAANAASEQIDYVGYNATAGSLDLFNNNLYTIRLYVLEPTISGFMQQKIKEGFYKSTSAATQYLVASGLFHSLYKNYSREPIRNIRFQRVCSAADSATSGGAVSVSYGSKIVSIPESAPAASDGGSYNGDVGTLVVGDFLRFGAAANTAMPVYRIAAITGAASAACTITLDHEYQGATASIAAANVAAITSAAGLAANWGLQISGIPQVYDGNFYGQPISWVTSVDFNDLQASVVTQVSAASPGTGTYDVLARLEKELQADEYIYRSFVPGAPVDRTDVLATTYDVVTIEYDGIEEGGLGSQVRSPKRIYVASAGNAGQADVAAIGWLTLLNNIVVTTWAVPGVVALVPTA
jgi:hypothetical protein